MKYLGPLLATGLTLIIILVIAIYSFLPAQQATSRLTEQSAPAESGVNNLPLPAAPDDTNGVETTMQERERYYQAQLGELDRSLQERTQTYQVQLQELTNQVTAAQNQLSQLQQQEQLLQARVVEIEAARADRLATYQNQLQAAQNQHSQRYAQLQTQLVESQQKLAEARAQLSQ